MLDDGIAISRSKHWEVDDGPLHLRPLIPDKRPRYVKPSQQAVLGFGLLGVALIPVTVVLGLMMPNRSFELSDGTLECVYGIWFLSQMTYSIIFGLWSFFVLDQVEKQPFDQEEGLDQG